MMPCSVPFALAFGMIISAAKIMGNPTPGLDKTIRMGTNCKRDCSFHFCKGVLENISPITQGQINILRAPGRHLSGSFCKGSILLTDVQLREALVAPFGSSDPFVPLSQYKEGEVSPPFRRNYFFPVRSSRLGQGLSRRRSKGNQEAFLNELCVTLPLKRFRKLRRNGSSGRLQKVRDPNGCVSFRMKAPRILFELEWFSQDDLDVEVIEPDGTVLNKFVPTSPSGGRLLFDVGFRGIGDCLVAVPEGTSLRENIRYFRSSPVQSGEYGVRILHSHNCGNGPTNFVFSAIVNGRIRARRRGTSNGSLGSLAGSYKIDVTL